MAEILNDQDELESRAVDHVRRFMDKSWRYTRSYFNRFNWLFGEYVTANKGTRNPLNRANLKPPYAYSIVESFAPQIVDAFLARRNYVDVRGRGPEDMNLVVQRQNPQTGQPESQVIPLEGSIENFTSYQYDNMDILSKSTVFIKNALLFGTAIKKIRWRFDRRKVKKEVKSVDPLTGEEFFQKVDDIAIDFDGPDCENISVWDFFPDANSSIPGGIQEMSGCVHRSWKTIEQLEKRKKKTFTEIDPETGQKRKFRRGIYSAKGLAELKARRSETRTNNSSGDGPSSDHGVNNLERRDLALGIPNDIKRKDLIEVLEYWGEFKSSRDAQPKQFVITLADHDVFLRGDENPFDQKFKPFVAGVDTPIPGEFYGYGSVFPVHSLIHEGKTLRNARLDQVNQGVNRMWLIDRNSGINVKNLYTRAGGVILTNDINGIKPLEPAETIGSSFREVTDLELNMQQAVGQTQPIGSTGRIAPGFGRTAQGVNFLQQITGSRLSLKIRELSSTWFLPMTRMMFSMNQQFLTEDQWIRVQNNPFNPFTFLPKEAFSRQFDFYANVALDRLTRIDRQQNLQQNILPLMQFGDQARPGLINWETFIPDTLRDFDYRGADKYVKNEQEYQQFQQQQQQQQQQAQQQQLQLQQQASLQNIAAQTQGQTQTIVAKETLQNQAKTRQNQTSIQKEIIKQIGKSAEKVLQGNIDSNLSTQDTVQSTFANTLERSIQ